MRIKANVEHQLNEGDTIGFGVCPEKADPALRNNLVFKVTTPEVVELDDSSENDIEENEETTPNGIPCAPIESVPGKELSDNQCQAEISNDTKILELLKDIEDQNDDVENQSPSDEESRNEPETIVQHSSVPTTSKVTKKTEAPPMSASDLKRHQEQLRHWNQPRVKLIEAPNMKKQRKRKASCLSDTLSDSSTNFVPFKKKPGRKKKANSSVPTTKRKPGRPRKVPEEKKEKLKKLSEANPPKPPPAPKPVRGVKVKVTKDNRGKCLTEPIPTPTKKPRNA